MILENSLGRHGYAQLLLHAIHTDELAFNTDHCREHTRVVSVWNDFEMQEVHRKLTGIDSYEEPYLKTIFDFLYPGLLWKYRRGFDYDDYNSDGEAGVPGHMWVVQASLSDLHTIFHDLAKDLEEGYFGGDDTVFDYWPSAFGCACAFANDLDKLTETDYYTERLRQVWDKRAKDFEPDNPTAMEEEVTRRP